MSDIIDDANDRAERDLAMQIKAARSVVVQPHSDECLNCGEPSLPGGSFCCVECRHDWERAEKMRKISGSV